ncbi:BRISC and BRCA1-A complex member 1-like [Stegodyphus dumicola]|uniref:BRISC and BRCA1-A complex member 1-like n=1 Tax=Stegodyphus dumicola TaxID=202533 RepID=UPI0015B1979C|nr:BRISC and BRCA1-A complex member 1-like [Stegodyphus dumicola]
MSSADDEDMILNLDILVDVEKTIKPPADIDDSAINPETFAKKCVVSATENGEKYSENKSISVKCNDVEMKSQFDVKSPSERKTQSTVPTNETFSEKTSIFDNFMHPCVPKINCSEKIIFCLDMSSEMEQIPFRLGDGSQYSPLSMVKRTIELFVENKHFIHRKHEYALMVLYESATWVREFTNDPKELIDSLEDLNETQDCVSCDLSSIITLLTEKYEMGLPNNLPFVSHIFRVILIYGRSNCMIHFSDEEAQDFLMQYPFLFFDVVYIHEPPSEENRCQEIFEALCDLDEQNKSYIFEVTRNTTKLHNCMAKLLAHSLQRCAQKDTFYKIRLPMSEELD